MKRSTQVASTLLILVAGPACGGVDGRTDFEDETETAAVSEACLLERPEASGRPLAVTCDRLADFLRYPDTVFASSVGVAEGELVRPGQTIPAHCVLTGKMLERVSPIDGSVYSIGFEMRLPLKWNRRFFYQANGGMDGEVATAAGDTSGGGPLTSALAQSFAVISSDAGHNALQNPSFGLDPQARLDYGYQAVGKLTGMAKSVIRAAYGQRPKYSYIGGCSNGGRHTMVAASRYAAQYDGYLVGSPGFNLPKAAVASLYGAQQYASLAAPGAVFTDGPFAGLPDISGAFTQAERQLVVNQVLEQCDALDGLSDGMVQNAVECQSSFSLDRDVPTCVGERDGTCLSAAQKVAIGNVFAGAKTSSGVPIYSSFPFDTGLVAGDVLFWDFVSPLILDSSVVGFVFGTPPADPVTFIPPLFALMGNVDLMATSLSATNDTYTESAESFMVPPDLRFESMRRHGGRMMVYHGVSDPIFSADDTRKWYDELNQRGTAGNNARLYLVPGMSHCAGGPATDQFDLLTPLVRWVEQGDAPRRVVASARGFTNPGGPNYDLPPSWSSERTRPLCAYPKVAVYRGGDVESADSFVCAPPGDPRF